MTELPQAGELPRTDEGYDPVRVEEAFTAFSERVRELESVAAELRDELRSLRAERTPAPASPRLGPEVWPEESAAPSLSPDWVAAVPPPLARAMTLPRLALEGVFLLLVALFAGLADLAAVWIVVVMVAAWALVALSEWAAAASRASWRLEEVAPAAGVGPPGETTGPWRMPIVEATAIESGPDPESQTIVAKLPAVEAEAVEVDGPAATESAATAEPGQEDATGEPPPKARRFRLRRRPPTAEAPADPWET